jgi:CheY-like chemotaxis protein
MEQTTTFLLVEDDPHERQLIEREFKRDDFFFRMVYDAVEATEYLEGKGLYADRERFPLPDVILLNLKMPRMDGFEFLEWMKHAPNKLCATPVVVMSSSDEPSDINRAYELGANGYFVKPIQFQDFEKRMKAIGLLWTKLLETPKLPNP